MAYPTSLDSFTDPNPNDPMSDPSHAAMHTAVHDALAALEAKLGIDSPSPTDDVSGTVTQQINYLITNQLAATFPVGAVLPYAGISLPASWLWCDGTDYDGLNPTYVDLYAAISTEYNVGGESANHFRVPNLANRVPVGKGTSPFADLGNTGGSKDHTLTLNEMPAHWHAPQGSGSFVANGPGGTTYSVANGVHYEFHPDTMNVVGSGASHNNLQPYIVLNYIIKY